MGEVIRIELREESSEERFSRFHLIPWWDQDKLSRAKVMVVGVGALGNEILKNLALLGVGHVLVADFDVVEDSNLSRSVLFRPGDNGKKKVEVAADSARRIYPEINIQTFHGNIVYDLGLGAYRWADIVLAGLDNREARLSINRSCYRVNRPWVDGAIEELNGVTRMFVPPDGACYECTMSERDWELLEMRRSCNLLSREEMEAGKVPTTPTIAAVIAGLQVQEAVKYIHGMPTMNGRGYTFHGLAPEGYEVEYVRKDGCFSHETYEPITELEGGVSDISLAELLRRGIARVGEGAVVELNNDVLRSLRCHRCGTEEEMFMSLGKVTERQGKCPRCGKRRDVDTLHTVGAEDDFTDRTFADIGVPRYDIVGVRAGMKQVFFEFAGDAGRVLGPLEREV